MLLDGDVAFRPQDLTPFGRQSAWHLASADGWNDTVRRLRAAWEGQLSMNDLVPVGTLGPCDAWREARDRELADDGVRP